MNFDRSEYQELVTQNKERWLQKADQAKPALIKSTVHPVRLVLPRKDSSAFQGVRMVDAEPVTGLPKVLKSGESLIADFGKHTVAQNLHLKISSLDYVIDAPLRFKIVCGEVPAEVVESFNDTEVRGQGKYPLSPFWLQDETRTIDTLPGTITLPRRTAFRYVKISLLGDKAKPHHVMLQDIKAESVSAVKIADAVAPKVNIHTSLLDLDRVSLQTLKNCMQTVFEDGPKRDRRLWLGDLRLQALTNSVSFQNYDLVKRCLYLFAGCTKEDGFIPACIYETPTPHSGNELLLDFAALFVPTLLEYSQKSGDWPTAKELYPVAKMQLAGVLEHTKDGLFTNDNPDAVFIDWHPQLDKQTATQGVLIFSLKKLRELALQTDRQSDIAEINTTLANMIRASRTRLWDSNQRLFVSGPDKQISYASQIWMVLAGVTNVQESQSILVKIKDNPSAIKSNTPYLNHYLIEAMMNGEMNDEAVELLEKYWGAMLKTGATTFYEVFNPNDDKFTPYNSYLLNSYCHGWSCTPSYFLRTLFKANS